MNRFTRDILPPMSYRTYYEGFMIIHVERFGLTRKPILPKNGIEVLNKSWVENNKSLVVDYMAI